MINQSIFWIVFSSLMTQLLLPWLRQEYRYRNLYILPIDQPSQSYCLIKTFNISLNVTTPTTFLLSNPSTIQTRCVRTSTRSRISSRRVVRLVALAAKVLVDV